jgi:hypothetical protein
MNENWLWIVKYVTVIVAALVLGAVLGGLEPFKSATIGSARIGAGALVQFIAHSGALALLWALGHRHAGQLRRMDGSAPHLAATVLALTTLVVAASAYGVLLRFVTPFLSQDAKPFLDWAFILGILAAAGWLLWALFADSEAIFAAIGKAAARRKRDGVRT